MRREYQTYKCSECYFETEQAYYAVNDYGNFHDDVDLQEANAEREKGILAGQCRICRSGMLENKTWFENHDPLFVPIPVAGWRKLLQDGPGEVNQRRREHPFNNPCFDNEDLRPFPYLNMCNLPYASFRGANLSEMDLRVALNFKQYYRQGSTPIIDLTGANLRNANLSGIYWDQVCLDGAKLAGANLSNSRLFRVGLENADLRNVDLRHAEMVVSYCKGANFTGCLIHGAKIEGFGRCSGSWPDMRSKSNLEMVKRADFVLQGENGDLRTPETCKFSPIEFGMYIDPDKDFEELGPEFIEMMGEMYKR